MDCHATGDNRERRNNQSSKKEVLVFCTAWASSTSMWNSRFRTWIEHILSSPLDFDQIVIFDDCSPVLPDWSDTIVTHDQSTIDQDNLINIVSFPNRLGRASVFDCEGWYRSFSSAIKYAFENDYKKVIHIESDAYLISDRAFERLNSVRDGWMTLWSEKHNFPEMAIQVIAGASLADAAKCFSRDYEWLRHNIHENIIPFTDIDKDLVGERYQDFGQTVPHNADWATQTVIGVGKDNLWWLRSRDFNSSDLKVGNVIPAFTRGWQNVENGFVWSSGPDSSICLTSPRVSGHWGLMLDMQPATADTLFCYQSVEIEADGKQLACLLLRERTSIILDLGEMKAHGGSTVAVSLRYGRPVRPSDLNIASTDSREIAVAVYRAEIFLL